MSLSFKSRWWMIIWFCCNSSDFWTFCLASFLRQRCSMDEGPYDIRIFWWENYIVLLWFKWFLNILSAIVPVVTKFYRSFDILRFKMFLTMGVLVNSLWSAKVRSECALGFCKFKAFCAWSIQNAHWALWRRSRVDQNVLTSQWQSSTQANWLKLASLLATSRQKWERTSPTILLALAELVRLFSCYLEHWWL
jgi:hypothetical protein